MTTGGVSCCSPLVTSTIVPLRRMICPSPMSRRRRPRAANMPLSTSTLFSLFKRLSESPASLTGSASSGRVDGSVLAWLVQQLRSFGVSSWSGRRRPPALRGSRLFPRCRSARSEFSILCALVCCSQRVPHTVPHRVALAVAGTAWTLGLREIAGTALGRTPQGREATASSQWSRPFRSRRPGHAAHHVPVECPGNGGSSVRLCGSSHPPGRRPPCTSQPHQIAAAHPRTRGPLVARRRYPVARTP